MAMQLCINNIHYWASENALASKTGCIHFHQLYGVFPELNILLGKTPIKVVREAKFLELIFNTKLTLKNYVQYLKTSFEKVLYIL